jgi:hypothetical protein
VHVLIVVAFIPLCHLRENPCGRTCKVGEVVFLLAAARTENNRAYRALVEKTTEPGVRELEREIAQVLRKEAVRVAKAMGPANANTILGPDSASAPPVLRMRSVE